MFKVRKAFFLEEIYLIQGKIVRAYVVSAGEME